jgi:hypothetical protein
VILAPYLLFQERPTTNVTARAIIIGLLCVLGLSCFTYFNDKVMRGTILIGNFLPIAVFGSLFLVLIVFHPLTRKISKRITLRGSEFTVIISLLLFVCYIPGLGLMESFTPFLMLPNHYERIFPSWQGEPPPVVSTQITDVSDLFVRFTQCKKSQSGSSENFFWNSLNAEHKKKIEQSIMDNSSKSEKLVLAQNVLNAFIDNTSASEFIVRSKFSIPSYARYIADNNQQTLNSEEQKTINRSFLDCIFHNVLKTRRVSVLSYVPPQMLVKLHDRETSSLESFLSGHGENSTAGIDWKVWKKTLLFWIPLILTLSAAVIGTSLVIHRQWATHERLPYPTVEFLNTVLPNQQGESGPIFQNRLFWLGTLFVFVIHFNNYAYSWWSNIFIPIPLNIDFSPLLKLFPFFQQSGYYLGTTFNPTIYFTVMGFAYFIASDISFSLGIAPYLFLAAAGLAGGYGLSLEGSMLRPYPVFFLCAGSYCAMFLVILYTGRTYYSNVFRKSLGFSSREVLENQAIWGSRIMILATVLFVLQLVHAGLIWPLAIIYTLIMLAMFITISRLVTEGGVFWLFPYFYPCALLWGLFGAKAIGLDQMMIMGILSSVFLLNAGEALMPFVLTAFKMTENAKCHIGKMGGWGGLAIVLGIFVALPVTLSLQYHHGALLSTETWTSRTVPTLVFDAISSARNTLESQGNLSAMDVRTLGGRIRDISPMTNCLTAFGLTFILVILFTAFRYRFSWWPIHPVLFLVLGTWQSRLLGFSFLIGWFIKKCITKYGGAQGYQRYKPLMIGLITGELLAGIIPMIIGAIYYIIEGKPPQGFSIFR